MPKTVTLRLDDDTYSLLKEAAAAQRRSLASFIEYAAVRHLEESAFLEPTEEAEIPANTALVKRIRTGHAEAKRRKGSFVRGL